MRRTGPNADYANVTQKRTNPLMAKKAIVSVKSSVGIRRRLRPEDRRRQILDGAISFFAEHGFEGGTRDLAKQLGVTQSLIFNYFPTKEELIREVYQSVYVGRWRSEWTDLISNTSVPLSCSADRVLHQLYERDFLFRLAPYLSVFRIEGPANKFHVDRLRGRSPDPPHLRRGSP